MNVGILGCGRVAQHYRKMLLEVDPVPAFHVVACCDQQAQAANELAQSFSAKAYTSVQEMLSSCALDLVLVLTPSGSHYQDAKQILEMGRSVLVEKPITLQLEQAQELASIAKTKALRCSSIFQNRYNPAVVALKQAFDQGRFKKVISASVRLRWCRLQSYYEDGWHGTWAHDGGVINQQAIHHIDSLRWIMGPVKRVVASMGRQVNQLEAEDTLVGLVEFENGALATIEVTTAARPRDFEASLSIVGEGGVAQIGGIALNEVLDWEFVKAKPEDKTLPEKASESVPTGYGLSHTRLLRDYLAAIDEDRQPPISVEQSMYALECVHALYASVEQGAWVSLKDSPRSKRLGVHH